MTLALLGGIVALVAVVIATSLLGIGRDSAGTESGEEPADGPSVLRGPGVPPPGVLPGRLWVVSLSRGVSRAGGEACWIRAVSLDELALEPTGKLRHCTLADVSLDGRFGAAFDDDLNLVLLDLRGRPRPARTLGRAFWDPSPRTLRVAALAADGSPGCLVLNTERDGRSEYRGRRRATLPRLRPAFPAYGPGRYPHDPAAAGCGAHGGRAATRLDALP